MLGGEPAAAATSSGLFAVGPSPTQGTVTTTVDGIVQSITFDGFTPTGTDQINDRQTLDQFTVQGSTAADTINLVDGIENFSRVNFNNAFMAVEFQKKTKLQINGVGNADTINLNNPSRGTDLGVVGVDGGDGNDTINVLVNHVGNLTGGNGDDRFAFADTITLTGETPNAINGGSGVDTVDLSGWTTTITTNLLLTASTGFSGSTIQVLPTVGNEFRSIDRLVGSTAADQLIGLTGNATWQINGANAYVEDATNRSVGFSSYEVLKGNAGNDTFRISGAQTVDIDDQAGSNTYAFVTNDAQLTGGIIGGAGNDTLDFSGIASAGVAVELTSFALGVGFNGSESRIRDGFLAINSLRGSANSDTLTGINTASSWTVSNAKSYRVDTEILTFTNIELAVGGSDVDTFRVIGTQTLNIVAGAGSDTVIFEDGALLNGTADGGDPTTLPGDVLDFALYTTPREVDLSAYTNFETVLSGTPSDTLIGTSGNDFFEISGPGSGKINGLGFSGFANLDGLAGNDSFTFTTGIGSLLGRIEGGSGTDSLSFSGVGASVDITLGGASLIDGYDGDDAGTLLAGFSNINSLAGGASADSLLGLNVDSTWVVATNGSYTANGLTLGLTSFEVLNGQSGDDTYNVSGTATATLNGSDGADVVTLANTAQLIGDINLGADNDRLSLGDAAVLTGSVEFFSGNDTLNLSGTVTAQSIGLTSLGVASGFDGALVALNGGISGGFFGLETLIGGSGDDLLQGLDTVAAWTIGASSTYVTGGQSLVFSGINNAVGGIDIDTFTVVSSATIDLAGNSGADVFNVNSNAALTGKLSGDGGDDVFNFTGVIAIGSTVIDGGFGFDTLDLSSGITGVSLNLDNAPNLEIVTGTSSTDTLVGTTGDDVFNILGTDNAGSTGSLNFTSFEHLRGNSGNDQFVFADGLGVTGSVDGGLGSDTVDYSAYTTAVSVNFVTNLGTNIDGGVTTVENATGGSGNDSLTGNTLGNTLIGGLGNDVLTDGFGNDSLDGGDGDDQYVLTPGSADIATDSSGVDVLDFSNSAGPISINLDSVSVQTVRATHTLQLSGVFENFIGTPLNDSVTAIDLGVPRLLDGRLGSDTFRTGANIANNWTVTAANQGVLGNTNFTQIENLVGGNNDDTFVFANGASVAGSIDGGGQAIRDTVNYGPATTALNISLSSLISIESLIGGGGQDTLTGTNSNTAYTINNADAGAVGTLAFSGVENIAAGTGTDSFTFTTNGFLTGSVNGGAGANTLTLSNLDDAILLTSPATVGFNGSVAAVTGFANVTSVNGGLGFDTLTGDDAVASWGIDGSNDYQSAGKTLAISDVENLVGGAGDDTFAVTGTQTIDLGGGAGNDTFSFADGTVLNGQLNGGLGTDKLLLIGSNNRSVSLGITGSEDGFAGAASFNGLPITTFDNLNSVQGGSGSDTLTGTGEAATVVLSPLGNTYSDINGTLAFSSIRGLVTGSLDDVFQISGSQTLTISSGGGDDSFRFLTSNAAVNGTIDGGDGTNDRLDYSAVTTAISASVANLVAIERVIGGASAADTLNGGIAGSTFSITANRAGSIDGVAFSGFETLAGASGADTFNIVDGGAVLAVSGGSGNDTLNWGGTSTARSVTLNSGDLSGYSGTEASVGQFSGIDTLAGSSGATTDALTGLAADAIWTVGTAADRSYVSSSRVLTFRNFEMLTGGSLVDTFNVTGSTTATINAGAGNDRIVLSAGAVLTGSVQGGAGTDTLDTTAISGAAFTLVSAGSTDGFNVTFGNVTGTVSNLNTIIAGSGADTVTGTAQPANWTIGTSDTYVVPPPPPAPALPPLSTRSIALTGIETRIGGSGIDTFNVQANSLPTGTQVLNGGAGGDVFNLNFAATTRVATGTTLTLIGGLSAAQLTNSDVVNINATAVGDGVRSIGLTYAGSAAGNVNVSGLGGAANNIALLTIEKLNLNGDSANNDTVTVTGTAAADQLTVSPSSNGGSVLLNGSGLGVAGGSTGPDIVVAGISTNGFNVSGGGPTTIPGDSLRYNGTGMITINTSTSGSFSQTGGVNLAYSNIEDLNPVNSLIFNINALASANNGVADTFLLSLVAGRVDVAVNGTTLLNEDPADIAGLIISGSSDDDALTVNFSGGIPTPATGVTFVGAGQTTGDSLTVIGTAASVATFRPSGTTNGTGTLTVDGAVINHTGVEPVTGNTLASLTLVTPNDADLLTVSSPVVGQSRITGTSGAVGFSPVNFAQVATVILDAATNGTAAADRVTFTSDLLATGLTSFQIATAGGADTINAATVASRGVSINAGAGNDTITGGGGNDSINGGLGTDTISQTVSGTQLLTNTSLTGAGTDALTGIETASLSGSAGNDTINASTFTGTTILSGLAGNDTITGGSAVDVIHGGDGDDSVLSGDGNDTIFGGIGNDVLNGGLGNDSVLGEVGLDSVSGGLGDDFVNGGDNFDTLVEVGGRTVTLTNIALTGLGTDVLANIETANLTLNSLGGTLNAAGFTVSQGTTLTGGSGNDTITGTAAVDLINGGAGSDIITAGDGNDFVYGGAGNDQINGGLGNDVLRGNAGNDLLTGDVGNDNIDGGLGDDQLAEVGNVNFVLTNTTLTGLGNDSLLSIELAALVGGAGANTINASAFSGRTTLNGGAGNDIITGGGANDLLLGMAGADVIVGGTGNDTITGGADNDAITGGDGTDTITATIDGNITLTSTTLAGEGLDTFSTIEAAVLTGGASNNTLSVLTAGLPSTLNGGDGDDVLIGGALNDLFNGGAGIDSISASGTNIVLTDLTFTVAGSDQLVGIENVRLTAGATASLLDASGYTLGSVTLIGGAGDDTLIGGTRADSIVGNGGNDTLVGNGGDDTIFGGIGLDSIRGGDGNDVLNGEDNDDVLDGGAGADQIVGGAGNDMIEAGAGDDTINGNSGNDTIRGGDGNDSIDGSVGNDLIYGDGGNDQILGSEGADAINGGLGDDNIVGGSENDTVLGLGGNDILVGGAGDDVLIGGDGDDKISGLGGIDKMAGNGGVDVLVGLASEIDEAFTELRFPFLM